MWFWFIVGFAVLIAGLFLYAANDYIKFGKLEFDTEYLGYGFMWIGGILATISFCICGLHSLFSGM